MLKQIPEHIVPGYDHESYEGTSMLSRLIKFQVRVAALRSDRGATAVEYGLMVALIAVVVIVAVTFLGKQVSGLFQDIGTQV